MSNRPNYSNTVFINCTNCVYHIVISTSGNDDMSLIGNVVIQAINVTNVTLTLGNVLVLHKSHVNGDDTNLIASHK